MPLRDQFMSEEEWLDHLRLWFAGMAMQGFLSAPEVEGQTARLSPAVVAEWAYQNADAMLAARKT